jgi:phytoene synthase
VLRRASDLGIAFQLTNIARDVVADQAAGRVYLPRQWLEEAGLSREDMATPANRGRLFAVVARLLDLAEPYYASSRVGMAHLPFRAAWAVGAASAVYRDIGTLVRQRGADAWDRRASTSPSRKLAGVAAGLAAAINRRGHTGAAGARSRDGLWTPSSLRAE